VFGLDAVSPGFERSLVPRPSRLSARHVDRSQIAFFACALLAISSCGTPDARMTPQAEVTVLFPGDERALGPAADDAQKFLVFLPLLREDGGRATPRLAERWEHSPDYRTWTFHLRQDVRWHDGVPVTADDVIFSVELFAHPDVLFPTDLRLGVESFAAPDDHTFTITWKTPKGEAALPTWTVFYPKHLLKDLDPREFYEWEFWTHPIGNGPYRYVRHVPRTLLELEANPDFYAGKPAIDRVILKFGGANKLSELLSHDVDVALNLDRAEVIALKSDPDYRIYHAWAYTEPQALLWNNRHPFLSDARVRVPLTPSIDRRELLRLLAFPEEMPLVDGLSPWSRTARLYREGKLGGGIDHDPEEAERILEEAGWVDSDGDGVRERNEVEASLTLLASEGGLFGSLEPALFIQDQLRRVGVRMEIQPMEVSVVRARMRSGEFDAVIYDVPNVPEWLLDRDWFGEGSPIGYRNTEVVDLLEALTGEIDPAAQDVLYMRINEILRRDEPVTFLFPWVETFAAHRRLRGLHTPERAHPLWHMDELWLDPGPSVRP